MTSEQRQRGGGLWTLAVGALFFGLMGCCGGALGSWGVVQQQQAATQLEQMPGAQSDFMRQMQPDNTMLAVSYAGLGVGVVAAILMFVIAILVLTWNPATPKIGTPMLGGIAVLTIVMTAIELVMQYQQMQKLAGAMGGQSDIGTEAMGNIASMGFGVTLCISGGWAAGKVLFSLWGAFYLRKETTRAAFGGVPDYGPRGQ